MAKVFHSVEAFDVVVDGSSDMRRVQSFVSPALGHWRHFARQALIPCPAQTIDGADGSRPVSTRHIGGIEAARE
jgi:hypothetical protein